MVIPSYSLYDFGPRNENEPTLQQTVEHVYQQANEQVRKLQSLKEEHDVSAAALHKLVAEASETAHKLMHTSLQVAHKVLLQRSATSKEKCEAAQESKDMAEKADLVRENCKAALGSLGNSAADYAGGEDRAHGQEDVHSANLTKAEGQAKRGAPPQSSEEAEEEQPPQKK
ncbi:hypothetical protein TI39_contig669g00009 [Zymoseptoria brevis]|uniref:Uncharacterized protein n=1 Tax=Zymoseptoria brevis TaxID=1047168 RepID=A0A0F4GGE0_9PEZI|nr:hypothetical protein TI39_contig669g00009 [Zymoseptoria brevis]